MAETALDKLTMALRRLHRHAGEPSTHEIGVAINYSHTTVAKALRGAQRPTWPVLKAIVTQLGGDLDAFRVDWVAVRDVEEPLDGSNYKLVLGGDPDRPAAAPGRQLVARDSEHGVSLNGLGLNETGRRIRGARSPRYAQEILNVGHLPLQIVVGTFEGEEGYQTVALRDYTAATLVAGACPESVQVEDEMVPVRQLTDAAYKNNLLLVGSPKRNPLTKKVLSHEATRALVACEFTVPYGDEDGERPEPTLRLNSKAYRPESLESSKLDRRNSADFALVAKIPNPFNPDATAIIVAGRHALGTQGAAEFLANGSEWKTKDFEQDVGDGHFAVVIYVEADGPGINPILTTVRPVEESLTRIDVLHQPIANIERRGPPH